MKNIEKEKNDINEFVKFKQLLIFVLWLGLGKVN